MEAKKSAVAHDVKIPIGNITLEAALNIPPDARGLVLFAHGSGSSRHSPRNQRVASFLQDDGMATLLLDLLTLEEEKQDTASGELRFNIPFLAERLMQATEWADTYEETHQLAIGYFGASTGAAAALIAAAEMGPHVKAVVSRGGRPDLAANSLPLVKTPTLLIVGGDDFGVIELNQSAFEMLTCPKKLEIVEGATHLFEERGALEEVSRMAKLWFSEYL